MSAHPGLVFVQPIKPGRTCFGFIELSLVIYPGCLNSTFVQQAPGEESPKQAGPGALFTNTNTPYRAPGQQHN